jgi:hypothetical protein
MSHTASAESAPRMGERRWGAEAKIELRARVIASIEAQGFALSEDGRIDFGAVDDKETIRDLHRVACASARARAADGLRRHENRLLTRFAQGPDIDPARIRPRLVEVTPRSEEELIVRYARLHWSIPTSAGYGRRLRYVVIDEHNDKLMGVIGLGDPVFAIRPRDEWIGWDHIVRRDRLRHVMDAFILGAVPPYSSLLVGKLIAALVVSDEAKAGFRRKYRGSEAVITERTFDGRLALVTTASALGRSSVYNRVRHDGRTLFQRVGYTSGSGEFHFANGLYTDLIAYATDQLEPSAKNEIWGNGWRSRREVVRRALLHLGLRPDALMYHGVKRELFVAPLAKNVPQFLRGEHDRLQHYRAPADDLFEAFRERWLLPRARRDKRYREFDRRSLTIWGDG